MDTKKIGHFISELRKEKGYTQKELAQKLMVSDKAVSRWETGRGLPETSILKPLSELLGVSVGELLSGERFDEVHMKEKNDDTIIESLNYSKSIIKAIILMVAGSSVILIPLYRGMAGYRYGFYVFGGFFIAFAILLMIFYKRGIAISSSRKAMYSFIILCQAAALIIELLPDSLEMSFASGPNQFVTLGFSYFSLTPFGYGHFSPILTGIMTIVSVVLSAVILISKKTKVNLQSADFICTIAAFVFSLLHIVYMTTPGYMISVFLLICVAMLVAANRIKERE